MWLLTSRCVFVVWNREGSEGQEPLYDLSLVPITTPIANAYRHAAPHALLALSLLLSQQQVQQKENGKNETAWGNEEEVEIMLAAAIMYLTDQVADPASISLCLQVKKKKTLIPSQICRGTDYWLLLFSTGYGSLVYPWHFGFFILYLCLLGHCSAYTFSHLRLQQHIFSKPAYVTLTCYVHNRKDVKSLLQVWEQFQVGWLHTSRVFKKKITNVGLFDFF